MNIGYDISTATTVAEALEIAQLNWKVKTTPTLYKQTMTPLIKSVGSLKFKTWEKNVESDKYVAILREDTQEEFAHVTKRYQLVQNQQAFGWVDKLIQEGGKFWRAGHFNGGRKVYMLIKQPIAITMSTGETIERGIVVSTSHDASQSIRVNWMPFRVHCFNIVGGLIKQAPSVSRHTAQKDTLLTYSAVSNILNSADKYFENYQKAIENMAQMVFYNSNLDALIEHVFDTARTPEDKNRKSNDYLYEQIHANFVSGRELYGKTTWEAYNAVCEYIDHQKLVGNKLESRNSDVMQTVEVRQYNSLLSSSKGGGNQLRQKAFEYLTGGV